MKLLIVSASHRQNSQSAKVANYLASVSSEFDSAEHIELCRHQLPYWDGSEQDKSKEGRAWPVLQQRVRRSDALVLITPEWGGTASPLLKNFLMMLDGDDITVSAHKPAMLVSVSNGVSGVYPIAELRMNAFKNNKIVAVPDHLIVRNVEQVLNGDTHESQRDLNLRERIVYNLNMLYRYAESLALMRTKLRTIPHETEQKYVYGM